jgi:2-dehydropantoate 2-reductase
MIISIIGSGALGKSYGGLLSLAGMEVHYLMRSEFAAIKEIGYVNLQFQDPLQTIKIDHPIIHNNPNELPISDLVIISVKTTENSNIASLLGTCLKANTLILIIQNGLGNEEWISTFTGSCPVMCGISTMGAYRIDPTTVSIQFSGMLKIAPFRISEKESCLTLVNALSAALVGQTVVFADNYKELRWHKLIWSIPFAGLSIIYDKDTQTLATQQPFVSIVRNVILEIIEVAAADGVRISNEFVEKMLTTTKQTPHYFPSMYRDYVAGKAIEKEHIFENVLEIARKNDIKTPMLNLITANLQK